MILVIGGTGRIGSRVVQQLASLGRPVKAVSPPMLLVRMVIGRRIADPFL